MTTAALTRQSGLDVPRMLTAAVGIIALLLLNKLGTPGNIAFFAILIAMIAVSPEMAFKAFSICFLGLVMNQAIVLKTPVWTVARFLIPLLCMTRFGLDLLATRQPLLRPRYLFALAVFIAVTAVLSVLTNYFVQIAMLKLANFAIGAFAIFFGVKVLNARQTDLTEWFTSLCLAVALLGLATIPLGIGYNFRGTITATRQLFNGPFYHSNCLGPLSAMMAVFMASVVIFGRHRNRWLCAVIAACLVYFMALTQSRTSFGAMIVGLLTIVGASFFMYRRRFLRLPMRVSRGALISGLIAAVVIAFAYDVATDQSLTRGIIAFAQKGKASDTLSVEDVFASRQGIIEQTWRNFLESPLIGIGFEVSKSDYFRENATLFNAPIEKGFLPAAVLEETGIIGTFFFVIFLAALIGHMVKTLNIPGLAMILTFLAVNCGESMFFSLGGHGAYGWLMMAAGMILGDRCVVRQSPHVPRPLSMPQLDTPLRHLQPHFGS